MDRYAKAIVSAMLAGLGTMYTALLDNVIGTAEWVLIASSVLGNLVLIWAVPNAPNDSVLVKVETAPEEDDFDVLPGRSSLST